MPDEMTMTNGGKRNSQASFKCMSCWCLALILCICVHLIHSISLICALSYYQILLSSTHAPFKNKQAHNAQTTKQINTKILRTNKFIYFFTQLHTYIYVYQLKYKHEYINALAKITAICAYITRTQTCFSYYQIGYLLIYMCLGNATCCLFACS